MSPSNREKTSEAYRIGTRPRDSDKIATKVARNKFARRSMDVFEKNATEASHFKNHSIDSRKRFDSKHSTMKPDTSTAPGKNSRTMSTRNNPVTPGRKAKSTKSDMEEVENGHDWIHLKITFSNEEIAIPVDFKKTFVDEDGTIAGDEKAIPTMLAEFVPKIDRLCEEFPKNVSRELKGIVIGALKKKNYPEFFTISYYSDTDFHESLVMKDVADTIHKKLFDLDPDTSDPLTVTFDLEVFMMEHQEVYERIRPSIERTESISEEMSTASKKSKRSEKNGKHPSNISFKSSKGKDAIDTKIVSDEKSMITECTGMKKIRKDNDVCLKTRIRRMFAITCVRIRTKICPRDREFVCRGTGLSRRIAWPTSR